MNRIANSIASGLLPLVLLLTTQCRRDEATTPPSRSERNVEPRLTIAADREATRAAAHMPCDQMSRTHDGAVQVLHAVNERPECLDAAVENLRRLARQSGDARVRSDLSAG